LQEVQAAEVGGHSSVPRVFAARSAGAAPRGDWGKQSPTPHKGHFCKLSKTDKKIFGVWREVTSPTFLEFQPEFVTSGFQRPDLTYILQLLTNFTLLNLFFCHLK